MRLSTSKYLVRAALIIFCFQFIGPVFIAPPDKSEIFIADTATIHKHSTCSAVSSILFEKTEKDDKGFDVLITAELLDFTVSYTHRISASQITQPFHTISGHLKEPALFTLHCIFLI